MNMVDSKEECEDAATNLGLSDTTAYSTGAGGRPHGCIYSSSNWLNWNDPLFSLHESAPCGSTQASDEWDCLCKMQGKAIFIHVLGHINTNKYNEYFRCFCSTINVFQ